VELNGTTRQSPHILAIERGRGNREAVAPHPFQRAAGALAPEVSCTQNVVLDGWVGLAGFVADVADMFCPGVPSPGNFTPAPHRSGREGRHFVNIVFRGEALGGGVGAAGDIENVSHAL
jgi:hypothetical protein